MTEHRNLFPLCPFVLGYEVGNIPLGADQASAAASSPGRDETGIRWNTPHSEPNSVAEKVCGFGLCVSIT